MRLSPIGFTALLLSLTGCANLQYGVPGQIPGTRDSPGMDGSTTIPSTRGKASQAASRQICRDTPMPRGWIAVDYVSAPTVCPPLGRDPGANAAIITRYENLPPEAVLAVCADQRIPYKWVREQELADAGSAQCPRRPGDDRTEPNVVRIRRP